MSSASEVFLKAALEGATQHCVILVNQLFSGKWLLKQLCTRVLRRKLTDRMKIYYRGELIDWLGLQQTGLTSPALMSACWRDRELRCSAHEMDASKPQSGAGGLEDVDSGAALQSTSEAKEAEV